MVGGKHGHQYKILFTAIRPKAEGDELLGCALQKNMEEGAGSGKIRTVGRW